LKGWKYDCSVDIYSFGILLWEICAKDLAFRKMSQDDFIRKVVDGEERPIMEEWWPVDLQWLMKKCWAFFPTNRPDAASIIEVLKEIIEEEDGDDDNDDDIHLRGIKSFRFGSRRGSKHSTGRNLDDRAVQSHRVKNAESMKKKGGFRFFGHKIF